MKKVSDDIVQRGYDYVESGFFDWLDWKREMSAFLRATKMDWSDDDIDEVVRDLWNKPYILKNDVIFLCDLAENKEKETKSQNEMRNSIDQLFKAIDEYKNSQFFLDLLKFSADFKPLAPYNAMMARIQMPYAQYVLTAKNWEKMYHRLLKSNARPLAILRKFGPVDFVFDIGDTEPDPACPSPLSDEDILAALANPYETTGTVDESLYERLIHALAYYGIELETFTVASCFAAEIVKMDSKVVVKNIETDGYYKIFVNDKADHSTAFASICHELGHLFCYHLPAPKRGKKRWWTWRNLSWEQEEFEAEIVSYLICERYGVGNKSWEYLSMVLNNKGTIPEGISVDRVFKAANEVERMLSFNLDVKSCYLYYYDDEFRKTYDEKNK